MISELVEPKTKEPLSKALFLLKAHEVIKAIKTQGIIIYIRDIRGGLLKIEVSYQPISCIYVIHIYIRIYILEVLHTYLYIYTHAEAYRLNS